MQVVIALLGVGEPGHPHAGDGATQSELTPLPATPRGVGQPSKSAWDEARRSIRRRFPSAPSAPMASRPDLEGHGLVATPGATVASFIVGPL